MCQDLSAHGFTDSTDKSFYIRGIRVYPCPPPSFLSLELPIILREWRTCYTACMADALSFATQLALQTGKLLLEHFSVSGTSAHLKADHTVVTDADLAADRSISQAIRESFPNDLILSEELQPAHPQHPLPGKSPVQSVHNGNEGTDNPAASPAERAVWIVDPLDGTTNFSLGLHYWGVSIARLVDGWPETAALYFPVIQELYTAERQGGARLNGEQLQVKAPSKDQPMAFFSCCSRTHRYYDVRVRYKTRILGSAAYNLCSVARGIAVMGFDATPKIWDIAGGWLVVSEAGGVVETLDGSRPFPLSSAEDYSQRKFPTLAAATPRLVSLGREQITPKGRTPA
jgi:myo-inositol-1(or 4)-monophosphatase